MFGAGSASSGGGGGEGSLSQDVREHLCAVQQQVLAGCRVVFSRIIPQGDPAPQLHHLWRLAEQVRLSSLGISARAARACKPGRMAHESACPHVLDSLTSCCRSLIMADWVTSRPKHLVTLLACLS